MILSAFAVFFFCYEKKKPQAREIVTLAVMSAIAIASRAAFAVIPFFKPMMGIIMITGIAFGGGAGFLAGTVTGFVSNFIFGQGPWTPWQMLAYGLGGALAGWLPDYWYDPETTGGGAMMDLGAHPMYHSAWMLGTPKRIQSMFCNLTGHQVEDNTISTIPPYTLANTSFRNWRGMQESGGRRADKSIKLDMMTLNIIFLIMRVKKYMIVKSYMIDYMD